VKAILETFQSVEYERSFEGTLILNRLESLWNILHKERSYLTDWKVSGIAFTTNAHTQQIGKFLE
jgi:hypothetical protein